MGHTERYGLNQFGGSQGGDLSDEGYKFSIRDRETIDRLLAAFEGHRHTGGLATTWAATTAYGAGARVLPSDRNGHVYLAITPGISASSEPTWPTGAAATVDDNEVTWQEGGSEATTQLPDPAGLPSAEVADDDAASLPAGTDLYYRVGFVDAYGLETAASDEVLVTTPDPLPIPDPPSAVTVAGGTLEDGPYYYAVSFWQEDGNLETELSDTTYVTCEVGNNTVELELPPLETGADGWKLYRLGPSEADLLWLATQLAADGTTYSDDGSTAITEPVQFPPEENTTNSRNKVTITAPDVLDDEVPAGVKKWRIYRSYLSGDYPDQSLVHEVVETTEMGGSILVAEWEDLGDPLLDGIPLDTSTTLNPPGPASLLLGSELPLIEGTASAGVSGAAAREDHVHPLYGGGGGSASGNLDDLGDVNTPSAANGDFLKYDGTEWVNVPLGNYFYADELADVADTGVSAGQVLIYDGGTSLYTPTDPPWVTTRGGGQEVVEAHGNLGASATLDLADGNCHTGTLDDDCTLSFAGATSGVLCSLTLFLTQDGTGSRTVTWPGSVAWQGGTAPTLTTTAGATDILTFVSVDGGTAWFGFVAGLDF